MPRFFVDSSVILNLTSADASKAESAEALMAKRRVVSVQVLNEVADICLSRLHMTWSEVAQFLDEVKALCEIVPLTLEIHDHARRLA
ncbi:hypothetical protein [Burkholderia multivorans]|uniref:hypothetical protein n=1 Tax=Burkholderia multivorans TaxID=87883 RepID=UPI00350FF426